MQKMQDASFCIIRCKNTAGEKQGGTKKNAEIHFVLFAFVTFSFFSISLCQEIGCEERLRNDLFYVEWDVKSELNRCKK